MNDTPLRKVEDIAWQKAHQILEEMEVSKDEWDYGLKKYELQYKIYHAIKEVLGLQTTDNTFDFN